jgi:hypothetical protein
MKANQRRLAIVPVLILLSGMPVWLHAEEPTLAATLRGKRIFTTPIVWVGEAEPSVAESSALNQATEAFTISGATDGYAALEAFLVQYPESRWAPSLHLHLAERYRVMGRYSAASEHWEQCWQAVKDSEDLVAKRISARALAGWLKLLGSLGRQTQMESLLSEAEPRGLFNSPYAPALKSSREGLAVMKGRPGDAFRCGSLALSQVMKSLDPTNSNWR